MESVWKDVLDRTSSFVKKPERFLNNESSDDFEKSKILLKVLYDGTKMATNDSVQASLKTLPELIIDEFDEEQVWAGVELQNSFVYEESVAKINQLTSLPLAALDFHAVANEVNEEESNDEESEDDFQLPIAEENGSEMSEDEDNLEMEDDHDDEALEEEEEESADQDSIFDDPDFQNMSDSDLDDKLPLFDKTDSEDEDEDENEEKKEAKENELEDKATDYLSQAFKAMKSNANNDGIEDKFLKLDEMDRFLDAEDAKAMRNNVEERDDDGIDYFDDDEQEEEADEKVMYKDFFDPVEGENNDDSGEMKSTHEMRTMRLNKKIKEMEKEVVSGDKPWQMTGEVAAIERPENALLQEHLDYDTVTKQAPIITEEVSKRLEDIIKQRIKDLAWDDVERKIKPVENPYEYKKKLILDQEKSKLSLAQVYEEEYLKQKGDLENSKKTPGMLDEEDEDKPETLDEIKKKMNELFMKLDTLTHYHYTPQVAHAEVKIVRNLPTLAMEEVAPVAMSDNTLLAPQEIVDKKRGEDIGSSERTETDKKRDLRLRKTKQRKIKKAKEQKEKLIQKLNPGLATKYSKKAALKAIEQAEKEGKVKTIKDNAKSVKSSKTFFDKMQNEVQGIVSDIKAEKHKKMKKNVNAAALKL